MKISFKKNSVKDISENYDLLERLKILAEDKNNKRNRAINSVSLYSADATPYSKQKQFDRNEEMNKFRNINSEFD